MLRTSLELELEMEVIIVGAGPSGLATAACLTLHSIPYMILEREDCYASIWKKYSYDRLHLHLFKQFCSLPHMNFPSSYPTYIPKDKFIAYLDQYVSHFKIDKVLYNRSVENAAYNEKTKTWIVKARDTSNDETKEYQGRFLVVATGEPSNPYVPKNIKGLESFQGNVFHSTQYKNGQGFSGKCVLVVGAGNSGMEIALDLANHGAKTSIVIRSPVHILSRKMMSWSIRMLKYHVPLYLADSCMVMLSKFWYGDMTNYGIKRPKEAPLFRQFAYGKYSVVDVGTCNKIRSGEIQVLPGITSIEGNQVLFEDGKLHSYDSIVFCTGFMRVTNNWLKDGDLLKEDGIPNRSFPNHWKGKNDLYCIGLSRRGLYGISADAQNVADHIKDQMPLV